MDLDGRDLERLGAPGAQQGRELARLVAGPGDEDGHAGQRLAAAGSTAGALDQGADLGAAGVEEAVGQGAAEALGVVGGAAEAFADQALAVEGGEEALDLEVAGVGRAQQGAGGEGARPAEALEERPLGPEGDPGGAVGEGAEQAEGAGVVLAGLDGQGALAGGRGEGLRVERDGRVAGQAEAAQAGRGQDDRVQLAGVDPPDPAVDVAADRRPARGRDGAS